MNSRPVWCYRDRLFQSQRGDYKKEECEEEEEERRNNMSRNRLHSVIAMVQKY